LDVMKLAKPVLNLAGKRDIKAPSLVQAHNALTGVDYINAHDALADCRATLRCLRVLSEQGFI
jgi:exonuclease I